LVIFHFQQKAKAARLLLLPLNTREEEFISRSFSITVTLTMGDMAEKYGAQQ